MNISHGLASDIGRVRDHQEDDALAQHPVYVVADGMGGHAAGEVASRIAVETFADLADQLGRLGQGKAPAPDGGTSGGASPTQDAVTQAVQTANQRIREAAAPEQRGMGTTATGIVVTGDTAIVVNIGDSRTLRWRGDVLTQVTTDHSEVQELVDRGMLTAEEAERHPMRNVITRCLGPAESVEPDLITVDLEPGDRYVICSDGLTGELDTDAVTAVLAAHADAQRAAEALVAAAVEAGGHDNVTVLVLAVD